MIFTITRRTLIAVFGGAALRPFATGAQQPAGAVIGLLSTGSVAENASRIDGLRSGLREIGFVEGRDFVIEFRGADGPTQLRELATELIKRNVTLLVGGGNTASRAAMSVTSTIPILFSTADDPVRLGFVASFNRPGRNMTGLSLISGALGPKRLELLHKLVPDATAVALLTNPKNPAEGRIEDARAAAKSIGLRLILLEATSQAEIEAAFLALSREKAEALLVNADAFFTANLKLLVAMAARYRVPAIYAWREFTKAGGLMSYGTSLTNGYRQLGIYAGRVLKGEKPADLPVIQPTEFELTINLNTAKALGLAIPPSLLALADDVIE